MSRDTYGHTITSPMTAEVMGVQTSNKMATFAQTLHLKKVWTVTK